jgi:glucose-6-phosphate isomerase
MNSSDLLHFSENSFEETTLGFALDWSKSGFSTSELQTLSGKFQKALKEMQALEAGAIANPDEQRMVGHYWLRAPELAPTAEIRQSIESCLEQMNDFVSRVHTGELLSPVGKKFRSALVIGIGGSALGPQFVHDCFRQKNSPLDLFFFDNTDPEGMARELERIPDPATCLVLVISKSGGTKETRNGMLLAKKYWEAANLRFEQFAIAITGEESELDRVAISGKWLARFPMWDWVGGRTSELSAVGLLAAALEGVDIRALLQGAREMDEITRRSAYQKNPAAILAMLWYLLGDGKGSRDMVVLPYKDRLLFFSRYLQQLIMESLGKELDLSGTKVCQGISVFGNKGSTDQHAYVQQLRDGLNNFFAVFIEVLRDQSLPSHFDAATYEVDPQITSGDYLHGFYLGTRQALEENNRPSLTVTIEALDERRLGALIALFERAVGYYANFVNINAYHQPGVEAGKKAAGRVIDLQKEIQRIVEKMSEPLSLVDIVRQLPTGSDAVWTHKIMRRMVANGKLSMKRGEAIESDLYSPPTR